MSAASPLPASSREGSRAAASGCVDGSRSATGRGSRPPARSRSKLLSGIEETRTVGRASKRQRGMASAGCRLTPALALLALAMTLGGCSSSLMMVGAPPASLPEAPRQAQQQQLTPANPNQREHQRILAAYNG